MSDGPAADPAGDIAANDAPGLTPQRIESILGDFRNWLNALSAVEVRGDLPASAGVHTAPDLHTLLGELIALRHEVHLQTKAVRRQQEQNAELVQQIAPVIDAVRNSQHHDSKANDQSIEELQRPLLKTLIDVNDALHLALREFKAAQAELERNRDQLNGAVEAMQACAARREPPPSRFANWWRRMTGSAPLAPKTNEWAEILTRSLGKTSNLEPLIVGYSMSLQRIGRALRHHGLEEIECVGQRFDPELMEAIEVVRNSPCTAGEVVAVVRPGFRWHGKLFRFAQVSVAGAEA